MTDQTTTPEAATTTTVDPTVFEFGGRKRKEGAAFAKFTRTVVFADLPVESQAFLIRYGIKQYLSDGAASAKDDTDFVAGIDARLENLTEADFTRTGSDGPAPTNDPEVLANTLARQEVNAALKAAKATVTKEQRAGAVTAYRTAHAARLVAEATRQIEARKGASAVVDLAALGIVIPAA